MKTDLELLADVLEELRVDPLLPAGRVFVRTLDGAVTLTGQLPSFDAKRSADGAVTRVSGVKSFESQISIRRDAPAAIAQH